MESHWENSTEWDSHQQDPDLLQDGHKSDYSTNAGSYHCKSALRDHESNMKLFLYKTSYNRLASIVGRYPYNDEALLLLPDLWNCFYHGTHSLTRTFDPQEAKEHSTGSPSFLRWADYTLSQMTTGDLLEQVLTAECNIWGNGLIHPKDIMSEIYVPMMNKIRRCLYLQYFINLALVVMNFEPSSIRSDVTVDVPGVCNMIDEGVYHLKFNSHLWLYITPHAVFLRTPIYSQILQKDVFLNLSDKISERINVCIGAFLISRLTLHRSPLEINHPDTMLEAVVERVIKWGDHLLYNLRNKSFDLIGMYEAFCVSAILLGDDPLIWDNKEFQNNLLEDIATNDPVLLPGARSLLEIINPLNPGTLAEIHGLWRIWGHPIIDLVGGLKKMETTCLKQANVDVKETEIGHRTFKYIFAKNYLTKHQHYPLSNMSSEEDFEVYREHLSPRDIEVYNEESRNYNPEVYLHACLRQHTVIDEYDVRYRHSDWGAVTFLQCFQIPQSVNLATMIKDKAISQTRTELISSIITRRSVFDPNNRRGVLKWLSEQTLRLKNFLGNIDEEGIPENDRIIGLYPKERELKTKARFFSLMSYKMRMYVTATEEILGKYLLPYFPMITMSDTLLNMIIRLYNMTTKIGARGSVVTYSMNIDFSKWNQNMRERTNDSIFKSIDRIIGFRKLISRTHSIFRESYLYLCSGEYVPQVIRGALTAVSPWSRIGDESGKEGLRQKGWTITTVCDIVSLAFSHGVRIELIGGGDNQVLTVTVTSRGTEKSLSTEEQRMNIRNRMIKFRNALAKKMSKRGLPLKLEETWISHRLLMYNKIMYLDGVPLSSRLKVISRMFSNSNEGILCLGGIMSTLGTGYQSLSSKDYDPILAWIVSRWLTLLNVAQYYNCSPMTGARHLDRAMVLSYSRQKAGQNLFGENCQEESQQSRLKKLISFSPKHLLSLEDLFLICLYYHKILGGPGIGTPLSYIMKGFPDPLSEALTFNYIVIRSCMNARLRDKVECLTSVEGSPVKHWEHLLEDPVAVNHNAPSHGIAALRSQASAVMKSATIKNVAFRELISIGDTDYLRNLSAQLCSPPRIEPRLLHDIVGSTIPGYVNTILSKVDQSSTLNKLASNVDVVSSIYNSEMRYIMFLANKIRTRAGHTPSACPTSDARNLRDLTWGKSIIGVTTPHPAAYLAISDHTDLAYECDHNYISVLVKRSNPLHEHKRGPFRPYFGSYTAEKFKSGILASAYGDEDILKRAIKIQKLLGWRYHEGTNMYSIIQGIMKCVTNADPTKFLPTVEEITGDVEHRYHDMATKHGGIPSNLTRDLTYVSCNTTTFIDHSKGAANETIHFQAAIIYCSMIASLCTSSSPKVSKIFHFHERCASCIQPIVHLDNEGEELSGIALASCPQNPLMYIEEKDIPVHYHNAVAFLKDQNKRQANKGKEGQLPEMVTFTEQTERSSWLLLAYASLLTGNMKSSAENLVLGGMTKHELIHLLRCSIFYNMLKTRKPTSSMNLCDVKDAAEQWGILYRKVLSTQTITLHLRDIGASITDHDDSIEAYIYLLLEHTSDVEMRLLEGAVCKYQDPEYKISRVILLLQGIPSIKTCQVCVQYWWNWAVNKKDNPCKAHMVRPLCIRYHMYSLDKLSRFAGLAKSPESEGGHKRGRPTLFDSIKRHKLNSRHHATKTRLSGFLYKKSDIEKHLFDHLCCNWKKTNITEEDDSASRRLDVSEQFAPMPLFGTEYVPSTVGHVINMVQTIMMIITTIKHITGTLQIGIEITGDYQQIGVLVKTCHMIRDILNNTNIQVNLVLFQSVVSNLEEVNLGLLKELERELKSSVLGSGEKMALSVVQLGEGSLDVMSVLGSCHAVLFSTVEDIAMMTTRSLCQVFIGSSSEDCYLKLAKVQSITTSSDLNLCVRLCIPTESVSFPYPCCILIGHADIPMSLSYDVILRTLETSRPEYKTKIGTTVLTNLNESTPSTISRDLYLEYVGSHIPITSSGVYDSIRTKLASGLMMFALKSHRQSTMPWRVLGLLSLIISLDIVTSSNKTEMLMSFSKVCGVSFSKLTYKEIILYRKGGMPDHNRQLINWTTGSIGERIVADVGMLERRVSCMWTTERTPSRRIQI